VAGVGAVLFFGLGLLDLGAGLVVVAGFIGWVTALALLWRGRDAGVSDTRTRVAIAAFLGGLAVVAGILIDWVFAVTVQGGVLGTIDYVGERYGIVAPLAILAATVVAGIRAR
jgi:hypothetical protein